MTKRELLEELEWVKLQLYASNSHNRFLETERTKLMTENRNLNIKIKKLKEKYGLQQTL